MRKLNLKLVEEKWVSMPDDEEIQLKVRPFPTSQGMYIPGMSNEDMWEHMLKKFNYCVTDWKGLNDTDGNPLECNEENKRFIFNYVEDIMMFGITQIAIIREDSLSVEKKTS